MFSKDFYPTPEALVYQMISEADVKGKTILEPSAGKGNIVDVLLKEGAEVICCEINPDLAKIVSGKCELICSDFLKIDVTRISHIDYIIMNPPFSADEKHILHAWDVAPPNCHIIALCNYETIRNSEYNRERKSLDVLIKDHGNYTIIEDAFKQAERKTNVEIAIINLYKPDDGSEHEFQGYFDYMPEENFNQEGVMKYDEIQNIVSRYTGAVKLYDQVLDNAIKMDGLISDIAYGMEKLTFVCKSDGRQMTRDKFKRELQRYCWEMIFGKLKMYRYVTDKLMSEINDFLHKQSNVPFTVKNIYRVLEIIVGTHGDRMERVIVEAFDNITMHYNENRMHVEGWKTNSMYMVNKKFILPCVVEMDWNNVYLRRRISGYGNKSILDLEKALCYISGASFDEMCNRSVEALINSNSCNPGQWYGSYFFRFKGFKKGSGHFEFNNEKIWEEFNRRACKAKGWQIPERTGSDFRRKETGVETLF